MAANQRRECDQRLSEMTDFCRRVVNGIVDDAEFESVSEDPTAPDNAVAILGARLADSTFDDMLQLQSHLSDWNQDQVRDWTKLVKFLAQHYLLPQNVDVLALISAVESNGFGVFTAKNQLCGRGVFLLQFTHSAVYPLASFFNHACDSNCESIRDGTGMEIIAKVDIQSGDEVTISYIDTNLPVSARQQELSSNYYFRCACSRCQREQLVPTKLSFVNKSRPVYRKKPGR
jgi:hypothetical protein